MSENDVLKAATRALRDDTDADEDAERVAATRARIMRGLHEGKRRRRSRTLVWLPLVAIFIGGAAWATGAGHVRLPFLSSGLEQPKTQRVETMPPPTVSAPSDNEVSGDEPAQESSEEPERAPDETGAETTAPANEPTPIAAKGSGGAAGASGKGQATDADAYALYQRAHELHFDQHGYAAARSAWEAYLAAAPGGRFASEAAYNRAICLARIGQTAEAKKALQPFANGAYGGYRQSEAQALMDAL